MESLVIVVSSPSGGGKTTICKRLVKNMEKLNFSVSYTSRAKRDDEKNGIDYYFITKEEFEKKIKEKDFIEYNYIYGNYYGTGKKELFDLLKKGDVLLDVDAIGGLKIKEEFKRRAILIYIFPPSWSELKKRLIEQRGESEEFFERRLNEMRQQITYAKKFDYIINNSQDIEKVTQSIQKIIEVEKMKVNYQKDYIKQKIEKFIRTI